MQESDTPEVLEADELEVLTGEVDDAASEVTEPVADEMLDEFEKDLDDVAQALEALDADDLDTAEKLTSGLNNNDVDAADADHEA